MPSQLLPIRTIQKLSLRNKWAFFFSLLSILFLFPGIYLSMLTITSEGTINAKLPRVGHVLGIPHVEGSELKRLSFDFFDTSRSILNTVHDLWNKNYFFVSTMIFLFSVIVPVVKGSLVTYVFFSQNSQKRKKVFAFIKSIGKWSMCDVFIVAVFLSYLSTGATKTRNVENLMMMGYPVHVNLQTGMHAHLQFGFWCFLSYCLLSLLALQLYDPY